MHVLCEISCFEPPNSRAIGVLAMLFTCANISVQRTSVSRRGCIGTRFQAQKPLRMSVVDFCNLYVPAYCV